MTRAAQMLHLTQPAVSGHLRTLEDELGLKLFERGQIQFCNNLETGHSRTEFVDFE